MTLNGGHYHYSFMWVQIRLPRLAFLTRILIFQHVFKARKANIHEYKLIEIIGPRFMKEISETLNSNSESLYRALCFVTKTDQGKIPLSLKERLSLIPWVIKVIVVSITSIPANNRQWFIVGEIFIIFTGNKKCKEINITYAKNKMKKRRKYYRNITLFRSD